MNILALDPSLSSTGYAIIDSLSRELLYKGKINTSNKESTDNRIQIIIKTLENLITNIEIEDIILEDGFVGFSAKSSLMLAELRGALIAYFKYTNHKVIHQQPKEIRKNFGLSGSAKKDEVANKVLIFYPSLETDIGPYSDKANKQKTSDIYDAISIGLSYIMNLRE